jgi:hypothetical protein
MTTKKVNARDIIVQVQAADGVTWLAIGGLKSVKPNPAENEDKVDTTTYDSQGTYEQEIMQRGFGLTLEGFELKDPQTGALDVGQARCETLATQTGYNSLGVIRFRHLMDTQWKNWAGATFSVGEQGGGNNDKSAWKCTVMRSGPTTLTTAP